MDPTTYYCPQVLLPRLFKSENNLCSYYLPHLLLLPQQSEEPTEQQSVRNQCYVISLKHTKSLYLFKSGELFITCLFIKFGGRDSSVGIATRYGLDGPGIESRWEVRFSAYAQTGPEAHPASCTMGTGSFPGVK